MSDDLRGRADALADFASRCRTDVYQHVRDRALLELRAAVEAERARCVKLVEAAGKKMWSTGYSREHAELVAAMKRKP